MCSQVFDPEWNSAYREQGEQQAREQGGGEPATRHQRLHNRPIPHHWRRPSDFSRHFLRFITPHIAQFNDENAAFTLVMTHLVIVYNSFDKQLS